MDFIESIQKLASSNKKTIVLPESNDIRILEAANFILKNQIASITLIGNKQKIAQNAISRKLHHLEKANIIEINDNAYLERLAEPLCEVRKHKGIDKAQALEILKKPLYFGSMLVQQGIADGMVAGATYTSGETLLSAVQIIKKIEGCSQVSSYFIMIMPERKEIGHNGALLIADCGLIENPDAEELAGIGVMSANTFKRFFDVEPKTAFLSYSTYGSGKGESARKVGSAVSIARNMAPDLIFDGEFQLDAAIIPEVNKRKAPGALIKGDANILIFPNLDTGNIVYKTIERFGGAQAYGPLTQGLSKPINDLSRGCSVRDIIGVISITAVQAQQSDLINN